jgi:hypothetical protein
MITRITKYWSGRKAAIMSVELTDADLTADGVLVYLRRRARRQLGWFTDSKARLERAAERRFYILLGLYGIAAVIAVAKLAVSIYFNEPEDKLVECLLRILLVITGLSAAMTASYISTNARSLIHRYNTQQRRVAEWLESFNERWPFAQIPSHDSDHRDKIEMRLRILNFEELMVDELIDWLHITSQDAIELAP